MKCPNCKIELLGSMKRCPKCGYDIAKGKVDDEYLEKKNERIEAEKAEKARIEEEERQEKERQEQFLQRRAELLSSFLSTTGYNFEGYRITEYLGIRSGESVLGTGLLSDLSAGVTDFFGVESSAVGSKLSQAKDSALRNLIDRCIFVGANAVIGVDLDITTYGPNMIVACANGTAVRIEKI